MLNFSRWNPIAQKARIGGTPGSHKLDWRQAVGHVCEVLSVSERRACRVLGQVRRTQRYTPRVDLLNVHDFVRFIWDRLQIASSVPLTVVREADYLEVEEVRRLLAACDERLYPAVLMAVNTGLRWGEQMKLQ